MVEPARGMAARDGAVPVRCELRSARRAGARRRPPPLRPQGGPRRPVRPVRTPPPRRCGFEFDGPLRLLRGLSYRDSHGGCQYPEAKAAGRANSEARLPRLEARVCTVKAAEFTGMKR